MNRFALIFLIGSAGSPAAAQVSIDVSPDATLTVPAASQPDEPVAVRNPYFSAFVHEQLPGEEPVDAALTPLDRLRVAGPWLKLLRQDYAETEGWERDECSPGEVQGQKRLCGLRWRKTRGFTGLRTRAEEVSTGMKARVFGQELAEHLEVDIDSSPEIKFEWDFD